MEISTGNLEKDERNECKMMTEKINLMNLTEN